MVPFEVNNDEYEEVEYDVLEFTLDDDEIDELIGRLTELKFSKVPFEYDIDGANMLVIGYEKRDDDEEGEPHDDEDLEFIEEEKVHIEFEGEDNGE